MSAVQVVLCTHGMLGKHDGEVRVVQGDHSGEPPPTYEMPVESGPRLPLVIVDVLAAPTQVSVVTLHRHKRANQDDGPLWAYVQPARTASDPEGSR